MCSSIQGKDFSLQFLVTSFFESDMGTVDAIETGEVRYLG